jgi:Zn-dependent protease
LLLHELGHAAIAKRAGIEVPSIDLWMLGGMARMDREPETPGEELKIALAGPAVTLLIAFVCLAVGAGLEGTNAVVNAAELKGTIPVTPVFLALSFVATMNIVIFVFNLIPAWPLDGGRVARALAWKFTGSKARGTVISAKLGRGFSWILAALGIFQVINGDLGGLWWLMLAFFIGQAARGALLQTQVTSRLGQRTVMDLMDRHPVTLPGDVDVARADEEWFTRYGWSWFPVVDEFGRFIGIAREDQVRPAAENPGLGAPPLVRDVVDQGSAMEWSIDETALVESLLSSEPLSVNGALMAVDDHGILQGVVTVEQVRAALRDQQE